MQRSTGFADIVEKVKPAVISVRVKVDATAKMTSMNGNDDASPMQPGAPLEKFFEQFGGRGMMGRPINAPAIPHKKLQKNTASKTMKGDIDNAAPAIRGSR